jgi:hypothetical protein
MCLKMWADTQGHNTCEQKQTQNKRSQNETTMWNNKKQNPQL